MGHRRLLYKALIRTRDIPILVTFRFCLQNRLLRIPKTFQSDHNDRFHDPNCVVYIIDYNSEQITDSIVSGPVNIKQRLSESRPAHSSVRWIHVAGIDWPTLQVVSSALNVHPLVVEDILLNRRIKTNNYTDLAELESTAKDLEKGSTLQGLAKAEDLTVVVEQVSFVLMEGGILLTLLRRSSMDAAFLMNSIMHECIDSCGLVLALYGSHVKSLESSVFSSPKTELTQTLHLLTRELSLLKRLFRSHGVVLASLVAQSDKKINGESWVTPLTSTYFNDVADDVSSGIEEVEELERVCSGLVDLIFNLVSFKQNTAMSALTIVSLFFLPMTFVAGNGMNFQGDKTGSGGIPELTWSNGYMFFWSLIGGVVCFNVLLLVVFRKSLFVG
ncbi:hypothetical protein HDU93_006737 [Gonapodya sp. JEL0774]|nr:hypothetical protein HDU93_006737 [Gonapodya sp. JEL0774]